MTDPYPPKNVSCGRLDDHDGHTWTRPRLFSGGLTPARQYHCDGPPLVEGGNPARKGASRVG